MAPTYDPVRVPRRYAAKILDRVDRLRLPRREQALLDQAGRYWEDAGSEEWAANSHWRDAFPDRWERIGRENLQIAEELGRLLVDGLPRGRTVEWGAGGGANAVHFAPLCEEFVAVDVVADSLLECVRQVQSVCDAPVVTQLVAVDDPENAVATVGAGGCDLFICFYVFELLPSPEYGIRVLSIASRLLADDGAAIIQIKYANSDPMTRSRRRAYGRRVADMTTYGIDEFWLQAERCGLRPAAVKLVPVNFLDERYAYFLLTKAPVT